MAPPARIGAMPTPSGAWSFTRRVRLPRITLIRGLLLLLLTLVLGAGLCAGLLKIASDRAQARLEALDPVTAVVATRALAPGTEIGASDLAVERILPVYLPDGVLIVPDRVVGRIVRTPILAGEQVRGPSLVALRPAARPLDRVPVGWRAVHLPGGPDLVPGAKADVWIEAPRVRAP